MDINGYILDGAFSTENAGFCQWAFARNLKHDFFIKKFIKFKYPDRKKIRSEALFQKKKKKCDDFYENKKALYDVLATCRTGNIMAVHEFFRKDEAYYAVSDKVAGVPLDVRQISNLSSDAKLVLLRSILYSFSAIHTAGIVHADVKPENILVIDTCSGYCCPKIIDFDLGFLVSQKPDPEEFGGDQLYFAPESLLYIRSQTDRLSAKIDMFSLGILFHEYWTGARPQIDDKYNFVCEAVLNDAPILIDRSIPPEISDIINRMLTKEPESRLSATDALLLLSSVDLPSDDMRSSGAAYGGESSADAKERARRETEGAARGVPPADESSSEEAAADDTAKAPGTGRSSKLKIHMSGKKARKKPEKAKAEGSGNVWGKDDVDTFFRPDDFD
ncbi:MAG: protein kinase [Succinivibrionaceae bacterium]|nr:protein kinase [Succinivibrionaceae bacterium]